ncbi:MAG: zinc ribbon domain-containing protein [Lutibacter sp.]|jgi:uncharacterized membrane protein YbaN (DUF454 family)
MKYCPTCGKIILDEAIYCNNCGIKLITNNSETEVLKESISVQNTMKSEDTESIDFGKINNQIKLKNNQSGIVKKSLVIAIIGFVIAVLPFMENNPLTGIWALTLIGFFIFLSAIIVTFIFKSREKKLQTLISGKNVLASWTLSDDEKLQYVNFLYSNEKAKNKGIFIITTLLIVAVFGIFMLFIDEGKMAMFLIMIALILVIGFFAFTMPSFYKSKNLQGDGHILIGKKFAYINGFFHNWDFPLSGIKKASIIKEPFYGLYFQYYYTDRTFTNTEELNIPAPLTIDLQYVLDGLKTHN